MSIPRYPAAPAGAEPDTIIHPAWLRVGHWLNAAAVLVLVASGWRIYDATGFMGFTIPSGLTLGGWLGGAIAWHFAAMWLLVANGLAQSWAFARGAATDDAGAPLPPYRQSPGRRPVTTILMDDVTPYGLGALLAFYEAKIASQGALWRINSFDQFGVELGKQLAGRLVPALAGAAPPADLDPAGRRQLDWLRTRT